MERGPQNEQEKEMSIEDIDFEIVEQNEETKQAVLDLMHLWPDQFIPGAFEDVVQEDFADSDIALAYDGDLPVGCLLYKKSNHEFNWLATRRVNGVRGSEIGRKLFETFYPIIEPGQEVQMFVNTEDATAEDYPDFTGKSFDAARKLYRSMGFEMREENRIDNHYDGGGHVYRISWVPNPKEE